jgi:hypothetical protein
MNNNKLDIDKEILKNNEKNTYITYLTLANSCYGSLDMSDKFFEFYTIGLKLKKEYHDKYEKLNSNSVNIDKVDRV